MKIKPDFRMRPPMLFILLFLTLLCTQPALAQSEGLSVNLSNQPIKVVFNSIQEQSDYRFFYSDDVIDLNERYSISFSNKSIQEALEILTSKTRLSFKIVEEKLIVVSNQAIQSSAFLVKGRIVSATDNEPLPGVNVVLQGTTTGKVCDFDGNYEIEVPNESAVLVFSFIGFKKQVVPVNARPVVNVALEEDVSSIEEVVVTALSIERDKNSLGYSITQVSGDDINGAKESNPINSLAGKVSGLQITKSPTGVDGSSRVVLRGVASMLGNNRPLFVIDGIPMNAGYGGAGRWGGKDSGDALSDLNPEDIESMSVLKGAGAAAAYGSRGANGVILITTKKGKNKKGIGVSFSSGYTAETPMVTPDFQYEYTQGAFGQYPTLAGNPAKPLADYPWIWSYGTKIEGQTETNWLGQEEQMTRQPNPYDAFFRTGSSFVNTISFDGGNENTTFRASITNQDSKGIMPNNDLSRQTINLRGFSKLGEKLEFDSKLTYIRSKVENRPYLAEDGSNIVQSISILPRNISLESMKNNTVDADGNMLDWNIDPTFANPYWVLENIYNADEKNRLQGMFSVKWDITDNFNALVRSGVDYSNANSKEHENPGRPSDGNPGKGSVAQTMGNTMEWNTDFLATYSKEFNDFSFSLSAGGNYRYNKYNSISQGGRVMKVPGLYHISNYESFGTSEWFSEKSVYSLYSLGQFSYKNYLYLDVTARNDWSSTLPLSNNSYFYHSENISLLFSEAFNLNWDWLDTGKIRASFAKVGNDTGAYEIAQYYSIQQTQTDFPLAGIGGQLPHFDLQPEETESWEVGTNLSFLKNRLVFDFTYYYSVSDNQIMNVDLTPSTGYGTKKMNAGKLQNTGYEVQLNAKPLESKNGLNWDLILTWSKNKSEVEELYGDMEFLPLAEEFHMMIQARPGEAYGMIYTTDYKRDAFGNKLIDKDGFAQAGEWKAMGNINPDWIGGINNRISYKDLSLNFLIDVQMGGDVYSWGKAYMGLFGTSVETLEGREEWNAGTGGFVEDGVSESNGQPNTVAIDPTMRWYNIYNRQIGTEWIQDATNVRLRELVLAYKLPSKWIAKLPVENVNFSLVGRNLFFLYRAMDHFDPETGFSSGNTGNGIEHLSLPSTTSYGVNLKINF